MYGIQLPTSYIYHITVMVEGYCYIYISALQTRNERALVVGAPGRSTTTTTTSSTSSYSRHENVVVSRDKLEVAKTKHDKLVRKAAVWGVGALSLLMTSLYIVQQHAAEDVGTYDDAVGVHNQWQHHHQQHKQEQHHQAQHAAASYTSEMQPFAPQQQQQQQQQQQLAYHAQCQQQQHHLYQQQHQQQHPQFAQANNNLMAGGNDLGEDIDLKSSSQWNR